MAKVADAAMRLEKISRDLHRLISRCGEPARSTAEVDDRISEGERIAKAIRSYFRGPTD